jgi:hypothetical protein
MQVKGRGQKKDRDEMTKKERKKKLLDYFWGFLILVKLGWKIQLSSVIS